MKVLFDGAGLTGSGRVDADAADVAEQRVEAVAADLGQLLQVEVGILWQDVGEPAEPRFHLRPPGFFALHFSDQALRLIGSTRRGRRQRTGQARLQQLLAQARRMRRPALIGHPAQERDAVQVDAVRVRPRSSSSSAHLPFCHILTVEFWVARRASEITLNRCPVIPRNLLRGFRFRFAYLMRVATVLTPNASWVSCSLDVGGHQRTSTDARYASFFAILMR